MIQREPPPHAEAGAAGSSQDCLQVPSPHEVALTIPSNSTADSYNFDPPLPRHDVSIITIFICVSSPYLKEQTDVYLAYQYHIK
jgi:hypothetical protein